MKKLVNGIIVDMDAGEIAARQAEEAAATPALSVLKDAIKKRIDADAERIREQYVAVGTCMAMTYIEKHNQAQAIDALGQTAANALTPEQRVAQYPTLAASVGIEGATLWDCAQLVIAKYEEWATLSNTIETIRLTGKKSVSDASDAAAVQAAYEAISWNS